ncbi:MAG: chorismate synthase [Saprospiraceae bacterium]|nr:chorismate synthase [Saprospiraceae bacterium]MBK6478416.1 chorismate synthase [Saprospiraceae bacterium]MBK6813913.1 chorismate synthase [Saprospiraceae bacterium]MBK7437022.1 chorismate synthase [Saprospiraceae bacterium]MBK7606736.1 chorismate synthase [Saprospiraceae bacterium]
MAGNQFGEIFKISTFGESHGKAVGVVIDGCPAGLLIPQEYIQREMDRRRPGQSNIVTQRKEADEIEILSGVFENRSTGAPICIVLKNMDQHSSDYDHIKDKFRPSHADFTYQTKWGYRDHRGGGRSSARETAARVASGAIAKLLLHLHNIHIHAFVSQVGPLVYQPDFENIDVAQIESNPVRCPDPQMAEKMIDLIKEVRKEGDTIGGAVTCIIKGCPPGLGEPAFDKLHAELGHAMLSINACKGFEIGSGFAGVTMRGSQHNDIFYKEGESIKTKSNHSGGIQGGISNGMDIIFRVAFKPVATIIPEQESVDITGESVTVTGKGRHDPCVVPRAVPIVEAMAAIVLADHLLRHRASQV